MAISFLCDAIRGRRWRNRLGDFVRGDEGNTVAEFGLVAPLFFTVMLAIFEVAMIFGTSVMLESAAGKAARAIRTGKIYLATYDTPTDPVIDLDTGEETCPNKQDCDQKDLFQKAMCDELILIDCADLSYDVRAFTNFLTADVGVKCDASGAIDSPGFDVGLPAQTVVVTVLYAYEPIIPNPLTYAGRDWKSAAEGGCKGLSLQSIMVFRNEPFPMALPGGGGSGGGGGGGV